MEALQLKLSRDNVLQINHPSLPDTPWTYLTAAVAAAGTALTVRDSNGFADTDLILFGRLGDEESEIKKVNGAVTVGTTMTSTALTYAHQVNTPIRKFLYDKIEIYGNSAASSSGAVLIATINIDPTSHFTEYIITGTTYDYYGARGIRSVATTYNGDYSDFIPALGYDTNTVGFIIKQAFDAVGETIQQEGKFSLQWAYDQIFLGEQDVTKELKKWSWLQAFDHDAGNVTLGVNSFTLPTNLADRNTPKNIQGLRIGKDVNLHYISKTEYQFLFQNVANTTVQTTYLAGAASIVLTDSRDMDDAGGFDAVSYTTNTRATNTVSGVTSNDSGGTAGDPVWQGEPKGRPARYTIFEGVAYFDCVPDLSSNLVGQNIWMDYYKNIVRVNSAGDAITVPDPLCIQYWLESMIKKQREGGKLAQDDDSWIGYQTKKKRLVALEISGQKVSLVPDSINDYDGSNSAFYL